VAGRVDLDAARIGAGQEQSPNNGDRHTHGEGRIWVESERSTDTGQEKNERLITNDWCK